MTEWFVGPIIDKLIEACFDYLKDQVGWQTGMKDALEMLQKLHPMIQSVVFASSKTHIIDQNPALNRWLWQLRDAIDEADDVLDEFSYMKHKEQLTRNKDETDVRSAAASFLYETARKIRKIAERAFKSDSNLRRLEEAVQKLVGVSAEVSTFLHLVKNTEHEQQEQQLELYKTRETGSLPKNNLIGRVEEKKTVMQWLKESSDEEDHQTFYGNISLLSIVGHGGMGKTTLLQHVYEDEMIKEFDLKMWVCVSNNFDAKRVIADMVESLKMYRPSLESLDALQRNLKSVVSGNESKKFLLVLDDVWEEDESKWENVLAPLAYGGSGSKILVTTRMDSVALMIAKVINKKNEKLKLEGLEEKECLHLLNRHAFAMVENPDVHHKLRSISECMVKKLSGSPLAAKVIGGVLNSNLDERHWRKVLSCDIGRAEPSHNVLLPILRLSYTFLPTPLKNCFSFCCIFPQDHKFDKDDLVRMWIALGFIQLPYNREETVEDIGGKYFDILVNRSYFEKFEIKFEEIYYKMHDLLHELAQSIFAEECLRVVGDKQLSIPTTIRHLYVEHINLEVFRKMEKFKNLRSLFFFSYDNNQIVVDVLTEVFKASRSIRLLFIYAPNLEMIPEAIENLIHLQYLRLCQSRATLPRSLSNLYHLQFIIYDSIQYPFLPNDFLPRDMNNLSNLHCLQLPWDDIHGMREIGKLNHLQELDGFYVKNDDGYRIRELEHMNDLRQLRIKHLENVKDSVEACSAKLCDKRNLTDLSLQWNRIRNISDLYLDEEVLDSLEPHNSLKKLRINAYMGSRSTIWMNNAHLISNLEYIYLDECLEWQTLPPFGQLPFLKFLYLSNMPKVKCLGYKFHVNDKNCAFESLEVLHIKKLKALEDWFDATSTTTVDRLFPSLIELYLSECPNLQELPSSPPKLKILKIYNIGWKAFNWLKGTSNCCNISIQNCSNFISIRRLQDCCSILAENWQFILSEVVINDPSVLLMEPLKSITSLKYLTILDNDELVSFPIEAEQWFLQVTSSLCELKFESLNSLKSLPSFLTSLSSLKILHVSGVPQLQLLPNIHKKTRGRSHYFSSLEQLYLSELESLQCLPSSLSTISSLKKLDLRSIPHLKSLQDLPSSLHELHLCQLENMDCLPSCLPGLSSLEKLLIEKVPLLRELPDLPLSLNKLYLTNLHNLDCLPSCLPSLSSLKYLNITNVPKLRELQDLPPLNQLYLKGLDNLDCLPSCLLSLSSLNTLHINKIPKLRELPDLPPSLRELYLYDLENLDCLPSCLPSISSLSRLLINKIPKLRELPDLPPTLRALCLYGLENLDCLPSSVSSLRYLSIEECHPYLMECYKKFTGSD